MNNERRKEIRRRRKQVMRSRKKPNKVILWFKRLSKWKKIVLIAGVALFVLALAAVIFVTSKFSKLDTEHFDEEDIVINDFGDEPVGVGYTNFVLFGSDSRAGKTDEGLNTDTIIIASLNNETKEVKLVSVYRDTLLDVKNGNIRKCNSAYASGGAKQAINMLNTNLDLNIQKYVTVDFGAVSDLVDMVGGIEADITQKEMSAMNQYIGETASVAGKPANYIKKTGVQTLDGVQATTYARIRKGVGDDYKRTERQRYVIEQVVKKAVQSDLGTINKIIDRLFPQISTNFTMSEILEYGMAFSKYRIADTSGFPMKKGSGSISGRGSSVFPVTLESNVSELHGFLFGTVDYTPSSKVKEISGEIAYLVGNRQPEQNSTWTDNGHDLPEGPTTNPDTPTTNPDTPATNPEGPTTEPEDPTNPNNPNENPDNSNEDSDNPNEDPDTPATPDNPDEDPDNSNDNPDNPTDPDDSNDNPDTPKEDPENTTTIPENQQTTQ